MFGYHDDPEQFYDHCKEAVAQKFYKVEGPDMEKKIPYEKAMEELEEFCIGRFGRNLIVCLAMEWASEELDAIEKEHVGDMVDWAKGQYGQVAENIENSILRGKE